MRLENWTVKKGKIHGNVFGHTGFVDGARIASPVVDLSITEKKVRTSVATYALGAEQFESLSEVEQSECNRCGDLERLRERIEKVSDVTATAIESAHSTEYHRGMANGLILAESALQNIEPNFVEAST